MIYRYTRNQKAQETKSTKIRKLRKKYQPQNIRDCEAKLSDHAVSTVDSQKLIKYIQAKVDVTLELSKYYTNENIEKDEREPDSVPFRKLSYHLI